MNPVQKALWFVESHFAGDITLDDVAAASGASRFYLTRAFAAALGQPLVRYMRGRRLSEAARALANGAPDILSVALEAGYGSHEAFTRAFSEQFGAIPPQWQRFLPHFITFRGKSATLHTALHTTWTTTATWITSAASKWFPASGHEPADGANFERYGETFDPQSGNGGVELWIPIRR
jgi:AraC-like DNA-binding protein